MKYDDFLNNEFDNMIKFANWSKAREFKDIIFEEQPKLIPFVYSKQYEDIIKTSNWKMANDIFRH